MSDKTEPSRKVPKLSRNDIIIRVAHEIGYCSQMIPFNPANVREIMENVRASEQDLPQLANVLRGLIPLADGGGVEYATRLWMDYLAERPKRASQWREGMGA